MQESIYKDLRIKTHKFIKLVYTITNKFPKSELYGTVSQLRRAAISIMLNYLEGFARFKPKVKVNFFEISYGSNKECRYLVFFALDMKWINKKEYDELFGLSDNIGAMLWKIIEGTKEDIKD